MNTQELNKILCTTMQEWFEDCVNYYLDENIDPSPQKFSQICKQITQEQGWNTAINLAVNKWKKYINEKISLEVVEIGIDYADHIYGISDIYEGYCSYLINEYCESWAQEKWKKIRG